MQLNAEQPIYGLVNGISYGQNERVDELNTRISERIHTDVPLQPNFDPRPIPTKYAHFPIINRRADASVPVPQYGVYDTSSFSAMNRRGPVEGYLKNVDLESDLRNQYYALQRGAPQREYVPASNSDLYRVEVPLTRMEPQTHPDLFRQFAFEPVTRNQSDSIGRSQFFNHTRTQLRTGAPR
jgi:hypothetical protein